MNMRSKSKNGQFISTLGGNKLPVFTISMESNVNHSRPTYKKYI